jgi:hypothetical protein
MDLYDVSRNTIANWIKDGLVFVPGREALFRGRELNAFHSARRERARKHCRPGEFLCFHCKTIVSLIGGSAEASWDQPHTATLSWSCPSCGKPNGTYQSRRKLQCLTELGVNLTPINDDCYPSHPRGEVVQIPSKSETLDEPVE